MSKILVACEESQAVCKEFRALGHEAYSCDILPCSGGHPEWHIQGFLEDVLGDGSEWDLIIAFPPCTYLTCSAEWAYGNGPYHQSVKEGTLTGSRRREARQQAIHFFMMIAARKCKKIAIENPVGVMSKEYRKPDQIIHPYNFGEDASKSTCLWLKGLPKLYNTKYIEPRIVNGKKRWGNQTDSGQNKLSPGPDRAKLRSKTYEGIAKAMASQWSPLLNK